MTKQELIRLLNDDLRNEYMHMHFYLHSSIKVVGLHREELREFLTKAASSEMNHVQQFADMIVGLGGEPECMPSEFPTNLRYPAEILSHALSIEDEVVENYAYRMDQVKLCGDLSNSDSKWVEAFLENQIIDSRQDADNLRQMIRGI